MSPIMSQFGPVRLFIFLKSVNLCAYLGLGVNLFFEKCLPYAFIWGWATIQHARVYEVKRYVLIQIIKVLGLCKDYHSDGQNQLF